MRWRRKLQLTRRIRKLIYAATVSVMISLAVHNYFGYGVSSNMNVNSLSISTFTKDEPKADIRNPRDKRNAKINRSLKRLDLDERGSNVRYVTIDFIKTTAKIFSKFRKEKRESIDIKRERENYKRAIKTQFRYTQMSDKDGLFNSNLSSNNNLYQKHNRISKKSSVLGKSSAFVKGYIRFYAKPMWFSAQDIELMSILSDNDISSAVNSNILNDSESFHWKRLAFSKDKHFQKVLKREQANLEGITAKELSLHEVLAYHLDRVLGLGRALPTVARRVDRVTANVLAIPENTLIFISAIGKVAIQSVEGLNKRHALACKSIQLVDKNTAKKCGGIDGLEWGKIALFDFLLQIHNRLNKHCCEFKSDESNACLTSLESNPCSSSNIQNLGTIYKDYKNLLFLKNQMNLKRSTNPPDFEIIKGIRKFPPQAVDILKKRKLKFMLLQSLFIDKAYWDGIGGRPGVENLINVIVDRAKLFVDYHEKHINVQ